MTADEFLAQMADAGRSPATINTYRTVLRNWGDRPATVDAVREFLRTRRAPASRALHLGVLRHYLGPEVVAGISRPRTEERAPRVITPREEMALFVAATERTDALLLLYLLRGSGLRIAEVLGVRTRRFDPYQRVWVPDVRPGLRVGDLDLQHRTMTVRGKGGRIGTAYLTQEAAAVARIYLDGLRSRQGEDAPLFQDRHGAPRGTRWGQTMIRSLARRAGIERTITPHMLRHTFLTRFLEAGGDLRAAQRLARHRNIRSTLIYADYCADGALQAVFDKFTRAGKRP